ncbi:unnamed protein product [Parajaminaea phylloscopi]
MSLAAAAQPESKRPKLDGGLVTHNGTFHADEALAVHLLRKLPRFAQLPLTRTRDPETINAATIVVDVGAEYDADRQRYDHHQRGFEETFDAEHKTKLSSAGLVWKHYGREILSVHLSLPLEDARVSLLHQKLYDDFVEAIDGIDNGIQQYGPAKPLYQSKTDLSARVGYLNPAWNQSATPADYDARFERASSMAGGEFFDRVDYAFAAWLPARQTVVDALRVRKDKTGDAQGRILLFDDYAAWKSHLFDIEGTDESSGAAKGDIIYVVYPDESGKWRVQAVPESQDSFASRKALPEQWRGVRDADLDALLAEHGIPSGAVFVHASGFIGGHTQREGALGMAKKALDL